MPRLPTAFTGLAVLTQKPVHRRLRRQIDVFVQQPGPHLRDRKVGMLRPAQLGQDP